MAEPRLCLFQVYFADGFDFADGGKLPGLFGGSRDSCKGCSGEGRTCFSSRLMWRTGGQGEVYSYQPYNQDGGWSSWCRKYKNDNHKIICSDHGCGTEIGKTSSGGFYFAPKKWYRIREEVNLGHVNQAGRISLWVDGHLKVNMNHIVLRRSSSVHIDGIFFSTFYGGNDRSYGRHGDTYAYFKNFKLTDEKYTNHNGEYFVG